MGWGSGCSPQGVVLGAVLGSLSQAMLDPSQELLQAPLFFWHHNRAHHSGCTIPSSLSRDQWQVPGGPSGTPGHWEMGFKQKFQWKCSPEEVLGHFFPAKPSLCAGGVAELSVHCQGVGTGISAGIVSEHSSFSSLQTAHSPLFSAWAFLGAPWPFPGVIPEAGNGGVSCRSSGWSSCFGPAPQEEQN